MTEIKSNLTCVSGYWKVKNKHNNYDDWFDKTLMINCPYIFFSDKETITFIKKYRKNLPTFYIEMNLDEFETYKYKDKMITHPIHCPSIELNLIWNEKIFLIKRALEINPYLSDFFIWVDAGICSYRINSPPKKIFPDENKLKKLPNDKFIFCSSNTYNPNYVLPNNYYHSVSGTFILHKNIIKDFTKLYEKYLDKLLDKNNIWTDQVILTHMFKDKNDLFFKLCEGYGSIIPYLY